MIDSISQIVGEVFVNSGQIRHTNGSGPDSLVTSHEADARDPVDRYIPSEEKSDYGIYTRAGMLENRVKPGETVAALAEEEKPGELDDTEEELVERLEARDREVRAHEQSHLAAAGEFARGVPTYTYQMGPDGKMYAIGGEVSVDVGKEADAAKNMRKAYMIHGAAMGVDGPSSADASVAAMANGLMMSAFQA